MMFTQQIEFVQIFHLNDDQSVQADSFINYEIITVFVYVSLNLITFYFLGE
jgi:hypothetical protein